MCVGVAYESYLCCCCSSSSYCVPPSATVVCGTRNSTTTAISDSSSKCKSRPIVMAAFHCHGRPIVRCIDRRNTVGRERDREEKREGGGTDPQTGYVAQKSHYGYFMAIVCVCVEIRVSDILLLRPNVSASSDTQTVARPCLIYS